MKVSQNPPQYQNSVERTKGNEAAPLDGAKTRAGTPARAGAASEIELSEKAQLMKKAADAVKGSPDVRADKISQLKKAVRDGTYQVQADAIADKLVDEHLATNFGKNDL